jgi:hypothetical protein
MTRIRWTTDDEVSRRHPASRGPVALDPNRVCTGVFAGVPFSVRISPAGSHQIGRRRVYLSTVAIELPDVAIAVGACYGIGGALETLREELHYRLLPEEGGAA